MKIFLILILFYISTTSALNYEERKSKLIETLQKDVGHHSSYSRYRHHHHHYHSASVERKERKEFRRGIAYGKILSRSNPRNYADYPGAYQPYYVVPYGYSYYTPRPYGK
jgi:hypothetical protein